MCLPLCLVGGWVPAQHPSRDGREAMAGDHRVMCWSAAEEVWFGSPLSGAHSSWKSMPSFSERPLSAYALWLQERKREKAGFLL